MTEHDCDLCGSGDFTPIEVARPYIGDNEPPVVCMVCGFIYVRERRSSAEVAKSWDDIWGQGYTSEWPAVKARLFYVAEWLDQTIGLKGKALLDIGAGEGTFSGFACDRRARCTALEPYEENFSRIYEAGAGRIVLATVEEAERKSHFLPGEFDIITILWTLENCTDCIGMLNRAREWLKPDGHIVVATGSRILVPFKKPLSAYFSDNPADTHCFRFSADSLARAMLLAGFGTIVKNRHQDSDWLIARGFPRDEGVAELEPYDDPQEVLDFFRSWSEQFP